MPSREMKHRGRVRANPANPQQNGRGASTTALATATMTTATTAASINGHFALDFGGTPVLSVTAPS